MSFFLHFGFHGASRRVQLKNGLGSSSVDGLVHVTPSPINLTFVLVWLPESNDYWSGQNKYGGWVLVDGELLIIYAAYRDGRETSKKWEGKTRDTY
ncbi:hypothetical protein PVK06_041398 [Gossypium arboreum]|uniref:Uncharacterized protein n=1 Tax=Gossypium arboreum TaxID=29729 RepID=A0ABR0N833_GOSAR|nr:hypothetical protein PVK06_041398 [Gossypium arboreum]